jgi:hypothetical protein
VKVEECVDMKALKDVSQVESWVLYVLYRAKASGGWEDIGCSPFTNIMSAFSAYCIGRPKRWGRGDIPSQT